VKLVGPNGLRGVDSDRLEVFPRIRILLKATPFARTPWYQGIQRIVGLGLWQLQHHSRGTSL
jgi:hypothetical protein